MKIKKTVKYALWLCILGGLIYVGIDVLRMCGYLRPSGDVYRQISLESESVEEAVRKYRERVKKDPYSDWKVGIRFYGKVIDQFGEPVEGVKATMSSVNVLGRWEKEVYSNSRGEFSLGWKLGYILDVHIEKEGYYPMSGRDNQSAFNYATPYNPEYHEPDRKMPVLFLLRKKVNPPKLIEKWLILGNPGRDARIGVDIVKGKKTDYEKGQLRITTSRPFYSNEYFNTGGKMLPYDWSFEIEFPDGGFIECKDEFTILAPESGYQSLVKEEHSIKSGFEESGRFYRKWYFRFGDPPCYGYMDIKMIGIGDDTRIEYYFNPIPNDRNIERCPVRLDPIPFQRR